LVRNIPWLSRKLQMIAIDQIKELLSLVFWDSGVLEF
jgi:hypothetical protein